MSIKTRIMPRLENKRNDVDECAGRPISGSSSTTSISNSLEKKCFRLVTNFRTMPSFGSYKTIVSARRSAVLHFGSDMVSISAYSSYERLEALERTIEYVSNSVLSAGFEINHARRVGRRDGGNVDVSRKRTYAIYYKTVMFCQLKIRVAFPFFAELNSASVSRWAESQIMTGPSLAAFIAEERKLPTSVTMQTMVTRRRRSTLSDRPGVAPVRPRGIVVLSP